MRALSKHVLSIKGVGRGKGEGGRCKGSQVTTPQQCVRTETTRRTQSGQLVANSLQLRLQFCGNLHSPHFPLPQPLLLLPLLCPATHVFCIHECYSIYVNVFSANCALTSSWDDELVLRSSSQMHLQMSSIVRHTPHTHTHTHTPHTCVHIFPIHFIPPPPSAPTSCLLPIWCALIEYINEISEFPFCGFIGFRLRRSNFIWKILQLKRILYFLYGEGKFTIG